MQAIKKRMGGFAVSTGAGLAACIVIFIYSVLIYELQAQMLLAATLVASGIPAGLWIREYKRLKAARLIVENQILHLRPAVIRGKAGDAIRLEDIKGIEVYVSYFGILLDTKIIKFNQDGIHLTAVEIGCDFISLTYGMDKQVQNTRLLREAIDRGELEGIAEKFRYETGIVPVIID